MPAGGPSPTPNNVTSSPAVTPESALRTAAFATAKTAGDDRALAVSSRSKLPLEESSSSLPFESNAGGWVTVPDVRGIICCTDASALSSKAKSLPLGVFGKPGR